MWEIRNKARYVLIETAVAIDVRLYTYCGNHPQRNPWKLWVPIAPFFTGDDDGKPQERADRAPEAFQTTGWCSGYPVAAMPGGWAWSF